MGIIGLIICVFAGLQTLISMCASCMSCCYSPYSDEPFVSGVSFKNSIQVTFVHRNVSVVDAKLINRTSLFN